MQKKKKALLRVLLGGCAGLINGLFGGGGGTAAVPLLRRSGLSQQEAGATSLGIIWPVCLLSLLLILKQEGLPDCPGWSLLAAALPGSALGAFLMPKIKASRLRKLFGILLIFAAVRMLFR